MDKYLGKRLDGRYELMEIVGVGGMAVVYKAYDNLENRIVAVKILKEEYTGNDEFLRRFINESKAIAVLSHPNVVKVYDVSFGDLIQYIVMEYIDGITLKEYIEKSGPLSWSEAVQFTLQILRGLQHAHDKGVVHRDIKPQNIMVLPDGVIKVADFGIARFARSEQVTITDKAIGSVHYISPEQAKGEKTDEKADLYSVGVMLYEMLTGKLPFQAESAVSVAIMQLQKDPTLPRDINGSIPLGLEQITMHAMQKDSVRRYKSASEMLLDLEAFKKNPAISFDYDYFVDDSPTKFIPTVNAKEEKKETKTKNKKSGSPIVPILFGVTTTFVIALIIILIFALPKLGISFGKKQGAEVKTPDFLGMTKEDIVSSDYYDDFEFEFFEADSSEYKEGVACKQIPAPEEPVKKGGKITITISRGTKNVLFPEVYHDSLIIAKSTLTGNGYKEENIMVEYLPHADEPAGYIIDTIPKAGSAIAKDKVAECMITLYVSSGPEENLVKLPNLIGEHKNNVESKLSLHRLKLGNVAESYHESIPAGYVCAMSPEYTEGAQVGQGTKIDIWVSKGKLPPLQVTVKAPVYQTETVTVNKAKIILKQGEAVVAVSEEEIDLSVQEDGTEMQYTFDGIDITEFPQTYTMYYYNATVGEIKIRDIKITGYEEVEGLCVATIEEAVVA